MISDPQFQGEPEFATPKGLIWVVGEGLEITKLSWALPTSADNPRLREKQSGPRGCHVVRANSGLPGLFLRAFLAGSNDHNPG